MKLSALLSSLFTAIDNRHLPAVIQDLTGKDYSGNSKPVRRWLQHRDSAGALKYVPVDVGPVSLPRKPRETVRHEFTDLDSLIAYLGDDTGRRLAFLSPQNILSVWQKAAPEAGGVALDLPLHDKWKKWTQFPGDHDHEALCDFLLDNRGDVTDPAVIPQISRISMSRSVEFDADAESGDRSVRVTFGSKGAVENASVPTKFDVALPVFTRAWPAGEEPVQALTVKIRVIRKGDEPIFRVSLENKEKALELGRRDLVGAIRVRFSELAVAAVTRPLSGTDGAVSIEKQAIPAPVLYLGTAKMETFDVREEAIDTSKLAG